MEPPDLVGVPKIKDGRTHYFPPAFLPREGKGFLLLSELNRCPRYMQTCCLELLTSRRLNDYQLPKEWLPIACINPTSEAYHTDCLDQALLSRFIRISVKGAVAPWASWAQQNNIHPAIIEYVTSVPNALDEQAGGSNPRSWTYASKILDTMSTRQEDDTLVRLLSGTIGPVHTTAVLQIFLGTETSFIFEDVLQSWPTCESKIKRWKRDGRLDLIRHSLKNVLETLRSDTHVDQLRTSKKLRRSFHSFFHLLPGDLYEQAEGHLLSLGCSFLLTTAASPKGERT